MRHDFRSARLVRACALVALITNSNPADAAPVQQESGSDAVARELLDQIERTTYSPAEAGVEVLYAEFVGRIVNFPGSVQDLVYHGEAVWTPASGFKVRMDADADAQSSSLTLLGNLHASLTGDSAMASVEDATLSMQGPRHIDVRPGPAHQDDPAEISRQLGWSEITEYSIRLDADQRPIHTVYAGEKHPGVPDAVPNRIDTTMRWQKVDESRSVMVSSRLEFWVVGKNGERTPGLVPFPELTIDYKFEETGGILIPVDMTSTIGRGGDEEVAPRIDSITLRNVRINSDAPEDLSEFVDVEHVDALLAPKPPLAVGTPAPDWQLTGLDGKSYSMRDLRGKVVVLDCWATWCGPCVMALPAVQRVSERFRDEAVQVIGVAVFEKEEALADDAKRVRDVVEKHGLRYPVVIGTEEMADAYHVSSIPDLFVIDEDGVIQMLHEGFNEELEELLTAEIERLLAKSRDRR